MARQIVSNEKVQELCSAITFKSVEVGSHFEILACGAADGTSLFFFGSFVTKDIADVAIVASRQLLESLVYVMKQDVPAIGSAPYLHDGRVSAA